jgi:hypothetical protein
MMCSRAAKQISASGPDEESASFSIMISPAFADDQNVYDFDR